MAQLVPPHHSEQLKPLLLPEVERAEERARAEKLRKIPLGSRAISDMFMLAMGAYTPRSAASWGMTTGAVRAWT